MIPALLLYVLAYGLVGEFRNGLYGTSYSDNYGEGYGFLRLLPFIVLVVWFGACTILAWILTQKGEYEHMEE